MIRELTPAQREFAELFFQAMTGHHRVMVFLTTVRSGKTAVWNSLEEYLRHHPGGDLPDFQLWLNKRAPVVSMDLNDPNSVRTVRTEIKPFRPVIVQNSGYYLSEYYGIPEARRLEICDQIEAINDSMRNTVTNVAHRIDRIADICNNAGEFAFAVHIDAIFLEKNGYTLT